MPALAVCLLAGAARHACTPVSFHRCPSPLCPPPAVAAAALLLCSVDEDIGTDVTRLRDSWAHMVEAGWLEYRP